MAQQEINTLPQIQIEELDSSKTRIEQIFEAGEQIFRELEKISKNKSSQNGSVQQQPAETESNGQQAFKLPDQAKAAFNTVASYVGWGGAAVVTVLLIRKILK